MLPRALLGHSTRLKDLSLGLKPKQDGSDDCGDPAMSNINLLGLQQHLGLIWGYFLPSDKPSVPAAPGVVSHPRSCRNGSVPVSPAWCWAPCPHCPLTVAPVGQLPPSHLYPEESPCAPTWPCALANCLLPASKASCRKTSPPGMEASSLFGPDQLV